MTLLQQVHMFTIGLGKPLRMDVELATPFDLQSMMSLTRAYERRHTVSRSGVKPAMSSMARLTASATLPTAASTTP
jgi:hypothetical protein